MKKKEDTLISRLEQIQISEREIALFRNRLATTTTEWVDFNQRSYSSSSSSSLRLDLIPLLLP